MSPPFSNTSPNQLKQNERENEDVATTNPNKPPKTGSATAAFLDPSDLRRYSISPFSQDGRLTPQGILRGSSPGPPYGPPLPPAASFKLRIQSFCLSQWHRNSGPLLIVFAQLFGAVMNLSTRVLELEDGLHPMQILCARMTATVAVSFIYMWLQPIPSAPWGPREIRPLLMLRASAGFVGLYGMWCSIRYLPLAEATVISFLAPNVAGYLCWMFLREPFTRREQLASLLALAGVILITRPISLFSSAPNAPAIDSAATVMQTLNETAADMTQQNNNNGMNYIPTIAERLSGILMGLLGVIGGAIAITMLRAIGPRAHPLISVNYFSLFCTTVSVLTLSLAPLLDYDQPTLRFVLPTGLRQCGLLLIVGLCGFSTQLLLTAGLAREKSNRGTGMIYTHVLFAAAFDRFVFGLSMGWVSVAGCGMVVGSALWVALGKGDARQKGGNRHVGHLEAGRVAGTVGAVGGEGASVLAGGVRRLGSGDDVEMEGLIASGIDHEEAERRP